MLNYIESTKYATKKLIQLINREFCELKKIENELKSVNSKVKYLISYVSDCERDDDFDDKKIQHFYNQIGNSILKKEIIENKILLLKEEISIKKMSTQFLCGALLQIAKQGIASKKDSLQNPKCGRKIQSFCIREIIINGRNQSMHFDEKPHPRTSDFFKHLAISFGNEFDLKNEDPENKALNIIILLDWSSYKNFKKDMLSLN
jgi:hypothetical protein